MAMAVLARRLGGVLFDHDIRTGQVKETGIDRTMVVRVSFREGVERPHFPDWVFESRPCSPNALTVKNGLFVRGRLVYDPQNGEESLLIADALLDGFVRREAFIPWNIIADVPLAGKALHI